MSRVNTRKLIVNADDFGLTEGVNQAVIKCYKKASVSSATLMINTDATKHAVELAKENPGLGVGLHFNLTTGKPLSELDTVRSLVAHDGFFCSRKVWERRPFLGLVKNRDIETEFLAQVQRYQEFGLSMTHIDSHQHMHVYPSVFSVVSKYCIRNNVPLRIPYVSHFLDSNILCRSNMKKLLRSSLLRLLIGLDVLPITRKRPISNDHFCCIFDFMPIPEFIRKEHYVRMLDKFKKGICELMVHPAQVDEKLRRLTEITKVSQQEYKILASFSLKHECQKRGIEFINYSDL